MASFSPQMEKRGQPGPRWAASGLPLIGDATPGPLDVKWSRWRSTREPPLPGRVAEGRLMGRLRTVAPGHTHPEAVVDVAEVVAYRTRSGNMRFRPRQRGPRVT